MTPCRMMWNGTVRALPLPDQLRAARLAGCAALSLTPSDYARWLGSGISTRDMLAMAADAGIRLAHLDPLVRWVPDWRPVLPGGEPFPVETIGFDQDDFFRMAGALGVESFTAFAGFAKDAYGKQQVIDAFGRLCARAQHEGLRCDLEFIVLWGIPDLRTAWRVVEGAGAPNSGIMLDLWNYVRGGRDDALLAGLPGDRITGVQLCDGTAELPPGQSLVADALFNRRVPGDGEWPVDEIVRILRGSGGLHNVGLEVFSADFDAMPAEVIGEKVAAALDALLNGRNRQVGELRGRRSSGRG